MKLFENIEAMLSEIGDMEKEERERREDRATVSEFFNGQPPLTQAEADAAGLQVNVNNLFGYTDLASAKDQMVALYTKPPRLWTVELDSAPANKKRDWEHKITAAFSRAVKKSERMRIPYEGVAGDATLHGEGEFFYPSATCPLPRHLPLSKRLIPTHASADPNELTHFALTHELSIHEILFHQRRKSEGWNTKGLSALATACFDKVKKGHWSSRALSAIDSQNPEELAYARQEHADVDKVWRTHVPVYYFFQADPDRDGRPLDLTILAKGTSRDLNANVKDPTLKLFERENYYPTVTDAIQPFFMDCILGGAPKWHRVKGLGHLNYGLAWHIEMLMSRMMQGAWDSARTMYQAGEGITREDLERLILKHNGILPENVTLIGNRQQFDFQGLLALLNVYRQAAARNTRTASSNEGGENTDELEVQAVFRQNQISAQQGSRLSNWYDSWSKIGTRSLGRYTNRSIFRDDPYYSEICEFQGELRRHEIPLYYVQPHNVRVTAYRITGDGDEQKALRSAAFMMTNIAQLPAESQQLAKREIWGVWLDDYEKAEALIPIDDKPSTDQVRDADGENNTCIIQGEAPAITATDVDETHVGVHFKGLRAILSKAAERGEESFEPDEVKSFTQLGGHTVAHIQRIESMGKKDVAKKMMEAINGFAKIAEKFRHNMEQKAAAQPKQQMDPVDAAKLQLEAKKIEQGTAKLKWSQYKFERTQAAKEHSSGVDTATKLAEDARKEEAQRAEMAARDVELALDVAEAGREPATAK